jgi:cytochrome bd-type quinol oxidase subunit 2
MVGAEARSARCAARDGYTACTVLDRINHVGPIYKYAVVVLLLVVIFSLAQALYYMMTDKDNDRRMAWALTRRIALSLLLIGMVVFGIWMGWLQPHGVGR